MWDALGSNDIHWDSYPFEMLKAFFRVSYPFLRHLLGVPILFFKGLF